MNEINNNLEVNLLEIYNAQTNVVQNDNYDIEHSDHYTDHYTDYYDHNDYIQA